MPPLPSHESTRSVAPPPSPDAPDLSPGAPPQSDAAADRAARADLAHGTEESVAAQLGDSAALNQAASLSPFAPLSVPVFRMLWLTWVAANTCMWMNDVAAAWLMTTLTTSPVLVALVQTASTLPVFLLGLPSGALADILDRRRYFIATQFWVAAVALVLCVAILAGGMTAPLLLALTFANGIGLAMRWPVFAAIVPELVSRPQLPAALALNGVAMNASRIIGPLLAGAIIASAGSAWVFVLNAVLSLISGFTIMRWKRVHTPSPLGREKLTSAMRVGLQFVRQSPRMRAVLWRISIFFLHATALLALLPLLAKGLEGGGAGTFTLLLASMGAGAITAAMFLPRLRQAMARDVLVIRGTALQAAATGVMAVAPNVYVAVPAMFVAGMAWITTANSLSVSAQLALPNWVRARGMSIYQMAIMGSTALGAAVWGQVATVTDVHVSLGIAAATGVVARDTLAALTEYGACVGLAFQVVDDILDVTADSATLGKTAGKDAAADKPTFVSLMGLGPAQAYADNVLARAHAALGRSGLERPGTLHALADWVAQRAS